MRIGAIQLSALLAALLLSGGLVLRISSTLSPVAPETRTDTAAERAIELRDGAGGVTLFEDVALAPGESAERCVTVRATGTRVPDGVQLTASSRIDPALAPWLQVDVTRGPALGDGRSCDGFRSQHPLVSGQAEPVLASLDRGVVWTPVASERIPAFPGHATSYRVVATLLPDAPDAIQGTDLSFDLEWSTTFDRTGTGLLDRGLALVVRFTEDSMIPMLAILALAILFLGMQDRLDTATPRLSQAALFDDLVEFDERVPADDG